jgi:hypothetical protein
MKRTLIVEGKVFELVSGATSTKWMVLHDGTPLGVVQRVADRYEAIALAVPNGLGRQSRSLLGLVRDAVERNASATAGSAPGLPSDAARGRLDTLPPVGTPGVGTPADGSRVEPTG